MLGTLKLRDTRPLASPVVDVRASLERKMTDRLCSQFASVVPAAQSDRFRDFVRGSVKSLLADHTTVT